MYRRRKINLKFNNIEQDQDIFHKCVLCAIQGEPGIPGSKGVKGEMGPAGLPGFQGENIKIIPNDY